MTTPNTSDPNNSSSYRVGLSTQHDTMINDNDIIMDTIADGGADIDVITGKHKDTYHNITKLVNTTLNGIGGASRVHEAADHEHLPGLHTNYILTKVSLIINLILHAYPYLEGLDRDGCFGHQGALLN